MIEMKHLIEELRNIAHKYPVFAGDTLSHATSNELNRLGWARRDIEGRWLPTAKGLDVLRDFGGRGE